MDLNEAAKASNALVAVTDFYGSAVGDLCRQLGEARAAVVALTAHTKAQAAEVKAQGDRLKLLGGAAHALLLSGDSGRTTDPMKRELRRAYEQAIGPVGPPAPAAEGSA